MVAILKTTFETAWNAFEYGRETFVDKFRQSKDDLFNRTGFTYRRQPLPRPSDDDVTTLSVPGYRQNEGYTCGWVAGLMVLHTFRPRASAGRLRSLIDPDPDNGASTTALIRALRASGVSVRNCHTLTFTAVRGAIEDGCPIITTVKVKGEDYEHWVVIYGVGVKPSRVFVAGNHLLTGKAYSWAEFRSIWSPRGNGLVCWKR